jgi:hypothetical protein
MALGVSLMSLPLCVGCDPPSANAQDAPKNTEPVPAAVAAADAPKATDAKPADTKPAEPSATPVVPLEAPATPAAADTNLVQLPVPPDPLKLTPALADVIKLVQAGVGEEVLMSYITNSTGIFNMGPNEILYLHDLGVPGPVITSLIQQDSTPEAMARKHAANAVQPLPPGVALSRPATNIFTPRTTPPPPAAPAPAPETADVGTDAPPADTNAVPAVIYTVPTVAQEPVNVSYFYTELAPYGTWIDYPGYGRCWRPTVSVWNSSWRPYCDGGRWLWTDCGWYWYSDYSWGASTFHYGRWTCPPGYGWLWVPDIRWGPSWVHWRATASHCGWAPAGPNHPPHHRGRDADFVFVSKTRLAERKLRDSLVSPTHAATLAKQASPVERVDLGMLPPAARERIARVSVRAGEPTVIGNSRRELLENNGRTLTVTPPVPAAPPINSPSKPVSSLSNHRTTSGHQIAVSVPGDPVADRAAKRSVSSPVGGPTVVPSGRAGAPIIMRGNSRPANGSPTASTASQPATGQPAITPDSGSKLGGNATSPQRAALPGGRRPSPDTAERSRSAPQVAVTRPVPATPAVVVPAPQPGRTVVARTEPSRTAPPPVVVQRAPASPASARPQLVAPAPVFRTAPSAPVGPTVSPRVDSYRAPAPAPAVRAPAPAPSSSGGSRPSYSRDSSGAPRGSR